MYTTLADIQKRAIKTYSHSCRITREHSESAGQTGEWRSESAGETGEWRSESAGESGEWRCIKAIINTATTNVCSCGVCDT